MLVVLVCQLVQATLIGILAERLFGASAYRIATFFNVVLVFVIAEAAPKTWAVLHPERSALVAARPVAALVRFRPIAGSAPGLHRAHERDPPGQGPEAGPVRVRGGAARLRRCSRWTKT